MEGNRKKIVSTIALQLLLSFGLIITAFASAYACFLVYENGSCVSGPAHVFFSVSRGQTFQIVTSAFLFFGQGLWTLNTIRKNTSTLVLGALLGSSFVVTLVALHTAAVWGSISSTLDSLDCKELDSLPRPNSNTTLKCNGYVSAFTALSVLSSLIFMTQGAVTAMLYMWQADFVRFESGDVYESIVQSQSPPSRHHFEPIPQGDEESSTLTSSMS